MMAVSAKQCRVVRCAVGRLEHGSDLLASLTDLCVKEGVRAGRVTAIGAVSRARLAMYDQAGTQYVYTDYASPAEIPSLAGNVSLKEGRPMVHSHVTLAGADGRAFGGHLAEGTVVFACEYVLEVFGGPDFEREHDDVTGLHLWKE